MLRKVFAFGLLLAFPLVNGAGGPYPASFDCPMRSLILEYAQHIQPWLSKDKLQEVADALNGDPLKPVNCTISPNNLPQKEPININNNYQIIDNDNVLTIFIDSINGNDDINNNDGSIYKPFKTILYGLNYLRKNNGKYNQKQILLRRGVYYLIDTLYFTSDDSNLIITNYNNEPAVVSGAVPLNNLDWKLYKTSNDGKNIYSALISSEVNITEIVGLRVNGSRAIRARYPNGNPEIYGGGGCGFCSDITAKQWYGAISNPQPDFVYYPDEPQRNDNPEHIFEHYNLGVGGETCYNFEPKAGYRCSSKCQGGGTAPYKIPTGMIYKETDLPNAPYANPKKAVLQAWRSGHWASWMFEFGEYHGNKQNISFARGGFQDGRGSANGQAYFVENVFEELDYETEWFFNETTRTLYYKNNITNKSPSDSNLVFEAVKLKVLMNYTGESMEKPIKNVILNNLIFKDSSITYLEPHGLPSGGDWALQRTGSLYMDNCFNFTISNNLFTRLDNIGISINRYNRYHQIVHNEFVYLGGSAITTWGDTVSNNKSVPIGFGYDGTTGIQPRFINISYNFGHEIGIWEKQSTFYFQGKSCQNTVYGNIIFNGPRSGININDGFGGGTLIKKNIIFNICRESGAHGPINSWDRQPYYTQVRYQNGTASMEKAYDNVTQNILLSNYEANFILDGDDGSNNYHASSNLFIYGLHGTKSTYGGHDIRHFNNMYGYVQDNCLMSNYAGNSLGEYSEYRDWYFNNTCIVNAAQTKGNNNFINWGSFACSTQQNQWPVLGNNTIYTINSNITGVGLCNYTETEFQSKYNTDIGSQVFQVTDEINKQFIQQAKELLFSDY